MYEVFYNLQAEPFRLSPDHRFCYEHSGYARARAYMAYAFMRAEGFVMITGRPGTGKTTLVGELVESLARDDVSTANLVCTQLEADDLLKTVAFNFGVGEAGADKAELLQALSELFHRWHRDGRRALLIVDEAQDLSPSAMEELRLLTNIQQNGQPLLQIFLLGQPELRDLILSPAMEQVHQRIVAASHLEGLEIDEVEAYVMHRLKKVGWSGDPAISRAIFPLLHKFSEGVPRRINLICSRLFLHGGVEQRHEIEVNDLRVVIKELQAENLAAGTRLLDDDFNDAEPAGWAGEHGPGSTGEASHTEAPAATDPAPDPVGEEGDGAAAAEKPRGGVRLRAVGSDQEAAPDDPDQGSAKKKDPANPVTPIKPGPVASTGSLAPALSAEPAPETPPLTAEPRPEVVEASVAMAERRQQRRPRPEPDESPVRGRPWLRWLAALMLLAAILGAVFYLSMTQRVATLAPAPAPISVVTNPGEADTGAPDTDITSPVAGPPEIDPLPVAASSPDLPPAASGVALQQVGPQETPGEAPGLEPSTDGTSTDGELPDGELPDGEWSTIDSTFSPSSTVAGIAETPGAEALDTADPEQASPDTIAETAAAAVTETAAATDIAAPASLQPPAESAPADGNAAEISRLAQPVGVDDLTLLVRFPFDSVDIGLESRVILDEAARILRRNTRSTARINGYADSLGEPSYNEQLSLRRARAVERYLLQAGVAASQLTAQGRGALVVEVRPADGRPISDTEPQRIVQIVIRRAVSAGSPAVPDSAQL